MVERHILKLHFKDIIKKFYILKNVLRFLAFQLFLKTKSSSCILLYTPIFDVVKLLP